MLKIKAVDLAKYLVHSCLKARYSWVCQWKGKFRIKFRKAHGEDCAEQCKFTKLLNLLQKFCADDIYNANKTGLFYRAKPDCSLSYKHATVSGWKKSKQAESIKEHEIVKP
jgi:hypothetical protein